MQQISADDDKRFASKQLIRSWEVIDKPQDYGDPSKRLRLKVTYDDGTVRVLQPSFRDRVHLDQYVARFHGNFEGKEYPSAK
jgi:hypothetical protein